MTSVKIVCEQAIFTSARGPTGEGYRIVAASKGLRAEEKQKITRFSPSHESLCVPETTEALTSAPTGVADGSVIGAAFYPLPGGRFCIAASRHAGAEHSGRGGQRVYTHNLVVSEADFEAIGFNPFHVIRAMPPQIMGLPNTPGGVIPAIELIIDSESTPRITAQCTALLPAGVRLAAVQLLLEANPAVINLPCDWQAWAEALFLSVPAPLRAKLSFAAGLRFSAARPHTLSILRDEKNAVRGRVEPQGICYLGARSDAPPAKSRWLTFVDRHWVAGDLQGLARRTSRKFEDCSHASRERVGELFNAIDDLPQTENPAVLDLVFRSFNEQHPGVEGDLRREFREAAQRQLCERLRSAAWSQVKPMWPRLVEFWRNGGEAANFVQPALHLALAAALRNAPLEAAELALSVSNAPQGADRDSHESVMNQIASRLHTFHPDGADESDKLAKIATRWQAVRPTCPFTSQLRDRLGATHNIS